MELIESLRNIKFSSFEISFGFGNPLSFTKHPSYSAYDYNFTLPFAGSSFRIDTNRRYSEYFKLIKLFSGLFNSEMRRNLEDYFIVMEYIKTITGRSHFYSTNGFQILNANMMIPILRLMNYQNNHNFLSLIDPVEAFNSDYISFQMKVNKTKNSFSVEFQLNLIFHANVFDSIFILNNNHISTKMISKSLSNESSTLLVNNKILSQSEFKLNYSSLKSFCMRSISPLNLSFKGVPLQVLQIEFYFEKSFVHIQNSFLIELSKSVESEMLVVLNIFFSIAEEPILSQLEFVNPNNQDQNTIDKNSSLGRNGNTNISNKSHLGKDIYADCETLNIEILTRGHKSRQGDGALNVRILVLMRGKFCKMKLPFFQKKKSFEEMDSDNLVYYIIPGVYADYEYKGKIARVSYNIFLIY